MNTNQTTDTQPAAELRAAAEAVIERHKPKVWPVRAICVVCDQLVPCDARRMASALLETVTALDEIQSGRYVGQDRFAREAHARNALVAAAAELEVT